MLRICEDKSCAGCMACVDICPVNAIAVEPCVDYYRPSIDQSRCIDCGRCKDVCQQLHHAEMREPLSWHQGWASDASERAASSSGGFASVIARSFVDHGGAVCACAFADGRFGFDVVEDSALIDRFRGSKYVKSNPAGAYKRVRELLRKGRSVLFIGLPCQVSSMRNYVGQTLEDGLYTIDLICHGTPSPRLLEMFLNERGFSLDDLRDITFRNGASFQLSGNMVSMDRPGVIDRYLIAFLAGIDYTENCYSCPYARIARVSDLTLGDSWGSDLVDEAARGISLALCQTAKGEELLKITELALFPVDIRRAIASNAQLSGPMKRTPARDVFFQAILSGTSFKKAVEKSLPKKCCRQDVKRILSNLRLLK